MIIIESTKFTIPVLWALTQIGGIYKNDIGYWNEIGEEFIPTEYALKLIYAYIETRSTIYITEYKVNDVYHVKRTRFDNKKLGNKNLITRGKLSLPLKKYHKSYNIKNWTREEVKKHERILFEINKWS